MERMRSLTLLICLQIDLDLEVKELEGIVNFRDIRKWKLYTVIIVT